MSYNLSEKGRASLQAHYWAIRPFQYTTGPKTAAGKARSRMNALKHGRGSAKLRRLESAYRKAQKRLDRAESEREIHAAQQDLVQAYAELREWKRAIQIHLRKKLPALADEDQEHLLGVILRAGGQITASELARASRKYRTLDRVEQVLDVLVHRGLGVWKDTAENSTRRFHLNTGGD